MRTNKRIFYLSKSLFKRAYSRTNSKKYISIFNGHTTTKNWNIRNRYFPSPFKSPFHKKQKSKSSAPPCHIFWQVPIAIHPRKKCRYFTRWQLCSMEVQNSATLALFGLKFCVIILCACWQVIWLSYRKAKMAAVLSSVFLFHSYDIILSFFFFIDFSFSVEWHRFEAEITVISASSVCSEGEKGNGIIIKIENGARHFVRENVSVWEQIYRTF